MQVHSDFVLRKVYGKSLLMPVRYNNVSNDPIFLNSVASLIWELAAMGNSKGQIVDEIRKIYQLASDSMEVIAVKNFIQELIDMKLIIE